MCTFHTSGKGITFTPGGRKAKGGGSKQVGCCLASVTNLLSRYLEQKGDVKSTLEERARPGQPSIITEAVEAHLTALVCSDAPEGKSGWTLRLLSDKMVELGYVESISHETIRQTLKKAVSSHGRKDIGALVR